MTELAIILMGIKSLLVGLLEWLKALGAVGLFGISLIDSVGVPLPGGPDAVMIWLSANSPGLMPFYALAATAGSAIGCTGLYVLARSVGVAALKRVAPQKRARIENLLGRYDLIAIVIPAILPPPFPFKPFVLCAGVFKLKTWRFITAIFIGRGIRFLVEGWLAIRFGEDAGRIIKQQGWKLLVATAVIVVLAVLVKRRLSRRASSLDQLDEARNPEPDSPR
jgi:membrane protein YqaA with SNARE-associated domain